MRKIIDKYRNLSVPIKASFWFLICGFFQKGISLITTPLFTRIMTEAEFGRYSVYNSWYNILSVVITLNLAAGVYTRGLIKHEDDKNAFSSSLMGLTTVFVVIFTVIYLIFHDVFNNLLELNVFLVTAMFAEMWITAVYQFWSNRERVEYRYKKIVVLTFLLVVLRPIAAIVAILNFPSNQQVEARVGATVAVTLLLFIGLFIHIMKNGKTFFNKEYWIYALKFNIPLVPHYLSQTILNQSDKIMISNYCGDTVAGYYSVAYSLAMVMLIFNQSVSATMNPWIYRTIKQQRYEHVGKMSYPILAAIAVANLLLIIMAPELLSILAPSSYKDALGIIPPVSASVYFVFLYNLFATFEYYFEKTYFVTLASVMGAALNIILNSIFIPMYGFIAAGYTTLACYIVYCIAHYIFMTHVCKKNIGNVKIYNAKIIVLVGLFLIVASAGAMMLYDYWYIRYGVVLAICILAIIFRKRIIGVFKQIKR